MSAEAILAAEKVTAILEEYLRSGFGSTRTTELIRPLLAEVHELHQFYYRQPRKAAYVPSEQNGDLI